MRFLLIILALVLIPTAASAGKAAKGKTAKYLVTCEAISGGQCKKECSTGEKAIRQIEIAEGDQKGEVADLDCSTSGKDFVCCVEKKDIKE
jgi:hypothetical protein